MIHIMVHKKDMKKEAGISKLEELIAAIHSRLGRGLVAMVLFGSRARGKARGKADWDIFVLSEDLPKHPFDRQIFFREMVPKDFPLQVSILPKTVEEFENDFTPIYLDIATDGIILYEKDHYIGKKLKRIREIIQEAGLKRVRKKDTLIWTWKTWPRLRWRIDWSGVYGIDRGGEIQAEAQ